VEAAERLAHDPAALELPSPRHEPVNEERLLAAEDELARPEFLRQNVVAVGVSDEQLVPPGQEPHRCTHAALRERSAREVEELTPFLVEEAPEREPLERRIEHRERLSAPRSEVRARRRSERGQIAAHEVDERIRSRRSPERGRAEAHAPHEAPLCGVRQRLERDHVAEPCEVAQVLHVGARSAALLEPGDELRRRAGLASHE
jgi:hypothetical protein